MRGSNSNVAPLRFLDSNKGKIGGLSCKKLVLTIETVERPRVGFLTQIKLFCFLDSLKRECEDKEDKVLPTSVFSRL